MELAVLDISGKETGKTVDLPDSTFAINPNDHAIYLDVKQYLANQRQGTHKTKERSEVSGSTRKIKKQKGTGTARAGSIKNPLFRGGGTTFGPKPRDYGFKLNKKVKQLARKSALSYKAKGTEITVLEDFNMEAPKTKNYIKILYALAVNNKKTLLILPEDRKNVYLSARNIPRANVMTAQTINTYQILNADILLICEGAVPYFAKA